MESKPDRVKSIIEDMEKLTEGQLFWVENIIQQFGKPHEFENKTGFLNNAVLNDFGDALRIHHCFSSEAFSKDKFEYVLERSFVRNGVYAQRAPRGNPGHDITIGEETFSLKTEAAKAIKKNEIHISKFMELGKGEWTDKDEQLAGLREHFFEHMTQYDRILTLRAIQKPSDKKPQPWVYELVEIPKALLTEAKDGMLEMMHGSTQNPKPGYCYVNDEEGKPKFQLYFDGGTERKLQIKHIDKNFCSVHAVWRFETEIL